MKRTVFLAVALFALMAAVLPAQTGSKWIGVGVHPFGAASFNAVAFGNGKFVALLGNDIGYSTNGAEWTKVENAPIAGAQAVAFNNGNFVVVGTQGRMYRSSDGITWTAIAAKPFGTTAIRAVIAGPGTYFMAVGDGGKIAVTTGDLERWSPAPVPAGFDKVNFKCIVYNNGTWIAGGTGGRLATTTNAAMLTWTAVNTNVFSGAEDILGIAFGGGRYVAVTDSAVYSSANGTAWSRVSNFPLIFDEDKDYIPRTVFFANGTFLIGMGGTVHDMATLNKTKIAYSANGTTWRPAEGAVYLPATPAAMLDIKSFAFGNGKFVGVGSMGSIVYSE